MKRPSWPKRMPESDQPEPHPLPRPRIGIKANRVNQGRAAFHLPPVSVSRGPKGSNSRGTTHPYRPSTVRRGQLGEGGPPSVATSATNGEPGGSAEHSGHGAVGPAPSDADAPAAALDRASCDANSRFPGRSRPAAMLKAPICFFVCWSILPDRAPASRGEPISGRRRKRALVGE